MNGIVYGFDPASRTYEAHDALIFDPLSRGGAILSLEANDLGAGIETIDLQGCVVVPAFADCHVHLTDTGYLLGERNLAGVRSLAEFEEHVARLPDDEVVLAGNYDESSWTDGAQADARALEARFPDRLAMLTRIDGHTSIVNRRTFAWLKLRDDAEGIERDEHGNATGRLRLDANWRAQAKLLGAIPERLRRDAECRAIDLGISRGALHLHVQLIGFRDPEAYLYEIRTLRALKKAKVYPKICERNPWIAQSLGLPYIGGDVFLDGSIGSSSAAVSEPYAGSTDNFGKLMLDDRELHRYFMESERLGVSAGVHAIGDRAIEQCVAAWEHVLGGRPSPRNRHFIEHFEVATQDQIERCARLEIYLSMQPQFDLQWGGDGGLYEQRLGRERKRAMNAIGRALRAGAVVCGGDDSPVCPLDPLAGMQAAVAHHQESERIDAAAALTMYTYDAARLGHVEERTGRLAPGYAADFVVLDRDPLSAGSFANVCVQQTWADGVRVM